MTIGLFHYFTIGLSHDFTILLFHDFTIVMMERINKIVKLLNGQIVKLIIPWIILSCGDSQYEYSSRHSYLVLDNSAHQDPTLASAMTPYSGVFVAITLKNKGGAQYFQFTSNQGQSTESIFNAIDQRRTVLLGMNEGLIVGYSQWSDLTFYAYDRECPNCFDPDVVPIRSKALEMSTAGIATCKVCHRKYDLNSGGFIVEGDKGDKLVRYRAGTTGAYGVLNVN